MIRTVSQTSSDGSDVDHAGYEDIIHLSRPESYYPSMPLEDRAAQFAPFAALSGHKEAIEQAGAAHEEPT